MAEPIVFVSHFRVKEGKFEDFRRQFAAVTRQLEADKPGTLLFEAYVDDGESYLTIFHVFKDAEAMDTHFLGAADRSAMAYEMIEPVKAEIFGLPSASAMEMLADLQAKVSPKEIGGFHRLAEPVG